MMGDGDGVSYRLTRESKGPTRGLRSESLTNGRVSDAGDKVGPMEKLISCVSLCASTRLARGSPIATGGDGEKEDDRKDER